MSILVRGNRLYLDFYFQGVRCREGLKLDNTKANTKYAIREEASILQEIAKGTFDYAKRFPSSKKLHKLGISPKITISKALDKYLLSISKRAAASTLRGYGSAIEYHLKPFFGDKPINELRTSDIREWICAQHVSHKRINNILIPLRGMLKQAHQDELIEKNPIAPIPNLQVIQDEPRPFTDKEIQTILSTATGQIKNLFQFAFFTGLRTSEIIALEWSDIDFNKGVIRVNKASVRKVTKGTKTSSGKREVKILPMAYKALKEQELHTYKKQSQIFSNPNSDKAWVDDQQIRKIGWKPLLIKSGLEYRNPYQTRHTYASMLLTAGENPMWVAQQMGHKDWGMIRKRYGRWIPDNDPHAGDKISTKWTQFGHREGSSD